MSPVVVRVKGEVWSAWDGNLDHFTWKEQANWWTAEEVWSFFIAVISQGGISLSVASQMPTLEPAKTIAVEFKKHLKSGLVYSQIHTVFQTCFVTSTF